MTAPFLEVVATLPLNSVQDAGRPGQRRHGVTLSGMVDTMALAVGNALLGNAPDAAGIEVQMFPFAARILRDGAVAVTGARAVVRLDGRPLPPWWAFPVRAGQVLELMPPPQVRSGAISPGLRACVAVAGGIDVPVLLGSRSTHLPRGFGGFEGRFLVPGDVLARGAGTVRFRDAQGVGAVPPDVALRVPGAPDGVAVVRAIPAAEHDDFTEDSRAALWTADWRVTLQSNRMGMRLDGDRPLARSEPREMRSHGIVPGVVQVPPSGQPIIQLNDGNTAGGYPKAAVVIEADRWRLAQVPPRQKIRFRRVDIDQARAADREVAAYLAGLRRLSALCRDTEEVSA